MKSKRSTVAKIKLGQQNQAGKPIYLLPDGALECGRFRYSGRYKVRFKAIFNRILELVHTRSRTGVLDVSESKYWDAARIYQYVCDRWCKSLSATRLRKFADETEIALLLEEIKPEFKRAVGLKWKKIFQKMNTEDTNIPFQAWQIL